MIDQFFRDFWTAFGNVAPNLSMAVIGAIIIMFLIGYFSGKDPKETEKEKRTRQKTINKFNSYKKEWR